LEYILDIKIEKVDRLNKRLDWKVSIENNNKNQILIKEQWICSLAEVVIEESEVDIVKKIKKAREKNKEIVRVVEMIKIKKVGVKEV